MQAIRETVDAETLAGLFSLPRSFTNRRLEITIIPTITSIEETTPVSAKKPAITAKQKLPRLTNRQIDAIVEKSAAKHLAGVLKELDCRKTSP